MFTDYDVIIIGSGCAGLAAGIYAARGGYETCILEKGAMGGEMMNRQLIENYPGFAEGVMGRIWPVRCWSRQIKQEQGWKQVRWFPSRIREITKL